MATPTPPGPASIDGWPVLGIDRHGQGRRPDGERRPWRSRPAQHAPGQSGPCTLQATGPPARATRMRLPCSPSPSRPQCPCGYSSCAPSRTRKGCSRPGGPARRSPRTETSPFTAARRGETAAAVNWLATGLACAAYAPGGVRLGHLAWCAAHPAKPMGRSRPRLHRMPGRRNPPARARRPLKAAARQRNPTLSGEFLAVLLVPEKQRLASRPGNGARLDCRFGLRVDVCAGELCPVQLDQLAHRLGALDFRVPVGVRLPPPAQGSLCAERVLRVSGELVTSSV